MAFDGKLSVQIDPEAKAEAMRILAEKGMTMSEFMRLAIRSLNQAKAIPFPVEAADLPRK